MYNLVLLSQAQRDMKDLDPQVARRIAQRLQWLAENFEQIKPESNSHILHPVNRAMLIPYVGNIKDALRSGLGPTELPIPLK